MYTFKNDDDFELFAEHLFGRDVPQRTDTVDPVNNCRRPDQKHETVGITGLRFQVEWVLTHRYRFTFFCQPSTYYSHHSHCSPTGKTGLASSLPRGFLPPSTCSGSLDVSRIGVYWPRWPDVYPVSQLTVSWKALKALTPSTHYSRPTHNLHVFVIVSSSTYC